MLRAELEVHADNAVYACWQSELFPLSAPPVVELTAFPAIPMCPSSSRVELQPHRVARSTLAESNDSGAQRMAPRQVLVPLRATRRGTQQSGTKLLSQPRDLIERRFVLRCPPRLLYKIHLLLMKLLLYKLHLLLMKLLLIQSDLVSLLYMYKKCPEVPARHRWHLAPAHAELLVRGLRRPLARTLAQPTAALVGAA
eukprot:COSAG06_NODE_3573_length_5172_cov_2.921545_2_plen_197_part_00